MKKDFVNIGFIGLGGRGQGLMNLMLDTMPDVNITAVCDLYADRREKAAEDVRNKRGTAPFVTGNYHEVLALEQVDAVITPSNWESHFPVCIDAMKAGKYAAAEVGGAYSVQQCWDLVRTREETGVPVMMLENCCYGQTELTVLNMVKKGLFGEIIHAEGGYQHDLREEVTMGHVNRHYRLNNYFNRSGDVYPTHELGPISKWLSINRSNRMLYLTSTASKSRGLNYWIKDRKGKEFENAESEFAMGDVVTTVIKCAHGETITLTHDTSLPRPYSRGNRLQGTKGIWLEDKNSVFFDKISPSEGWDHSWESIEKYYDEYMHPLWKWYVKHGVEAGHGGMDYLVLRAFAEAVMNGTEPPIDVYDMASWAVITCLSEESVAMGSHPVPIPDFTNGKWINREPAIRGKYCLDEICEP